jgi:hypothetical protein
MISERLRFVARGGSENVNRSGRATIVPVLTVEPWLLGESLPPAPTGLDIAFFYPVEEDFNNDYLTFRILIDIGRMP